MPQRRLQLTPPQCRSDASRNSQLREVPCPRAGTKVSKRRAGDLDVLLLRKRGTSTRAKRNARDAVEVRASRTRVAEGVAAKRVGASARRHASRFSQRTAASRRNEAAIRRTSSPLARAARVEYPVIQLSSQCVVHTQRALSMNEFGCPTLS